MNVHFVEGGVIVKDENYEALEGKIIDVWSEDKTIKFQAIIIGCDPDIGIIIIGCDPDIGITIIKKDDPNCYLACLKGPSSSLWPKKRQKGFCKKRYKTMFNLIINEIKKDIFDYSIIEKKWISLSGEIPNQATKETCPFAQ